MLFAGLDVSTQSCKLIVIDFQNSETVFQHVINYDTDLPEYGTKNGVITGLEEGASESDPLMWLKAVDRVFQELKSSGIAVDQIRCVSVSGQQHGLVALDEQGKLSRKRSKLWNDFSTRDECDMLTEAVGGAQEMIAEIGNTQRTGYTAAKIYHMFRHERELYDRTRIFFLVHNYINWYLTGGVCVMEPGDTSGIALWHPGNAVWSQKVINAIDGGLRKKLPEIRPSDQSVGKISPDLAAKFGFSSDCRIDAGSGDNMYGAIGTGNIETGIVTVSLGTSGTAYTFLEKPFIDPEGEIAAFCDSTGNHLPLLCVSNLANGYNQLLHQYDIDHEQFNQLIKKTKAGNDGRLLIPWYEGERTPDVPQAAPVYLGFGLDEFTRENLSRAVLEGHILNLYDGFRRLPVKPKEIRLTGGLSRSVSWRQTIADIFNTAVVPVQGEGAALGAALHAAWVWIKENNRESSLADVIRPFIKLDEAQRCTPIPENVSVYNHQKQLFHDLSQAVRTKDAGDLFTMRTKLVNM